MESFVVSGAIGPQVVPCNGCPQNWLHRKTQSRKSREPPFFHVRQVDHEGHQSEIGKKSSNFYRKYSKILIVEKDLKIEVDVFNFPELHLAQYSLAVHSNESSTKNNNNIGTIAWHLLNKPIWHSFRTKKKTFKAGKY